MFTAANAKEMASLSVAARKQQREAKVQTSVQVLTLLAQAQLSPQPSNDPLAHKLAHAIDSTLDELCDSDDPKCKAMLAQALRNLRETYHLVTGQPRPGQIKSVAPRTRTQSYPSPEVIPEPIAIEAQVSSVPMARPNAGCGPAQAPVPVQPNPTVAVNAPALPEPTDLPPG